MTSPHDTGTPEDVTSVVVDGAAPDDDDEREPVDPGATLESGETSLGWSWYLVRVSGLFLAVLLPLHFAVVILRDDVGRTTLGTVTSRFADSRWQAIELVTLLLALLHSFLALRRVTLASARLPPTASDRVVVALGAVAVLLALAVAWAMLSLS